MNCDFCGDKIPEGELPIPEEAGAWACRACWDYWEAHDGQARPIPSRQGEAALTEGLPCTSEVETIEPKGYSIESPALTAKTNVIRCLLCGWEHEEPDARRAIPAGMFAAFSDPPALAAIMHRQMRERLEDAMNKHVSTAHNPLANEKP